MDKNIIFISNCCLGGDIHCKFSDSEYTNPFIATLIPEDSHFLKLCENFLEYIDFEPKCDLFPSNTTIYSKQVNNIWYNNTAINPPYPIIHLNDIEIHCIHEKNIDETLIKFKRRLNRLKSIILNNNYTIFIIMTWTNLFTIHDNNDYKPFITRFLSNNNKNDKIIFIFLGPTNYIVDNFYINDSLFNLNITRKTDNVNNKIDFGRESNLILDFIRNN